VAANKTRRKLDRETIEHNRNKKQKREMRQLGCSNYKDMSAYLMDFGFGGFIGYGKGVSVGLVMEELNIRMRYY